MNAFTPFFYTKLGNLLTFETLSTLEHFGLESQVNHFLINKIQHFSTNQLDIRIFHQSKIKAKFYDFLSLLDNYAVKMKWNCRLPQWRRAFAYQISLAVSFSNKFALVVSTVFSFGVFRSCWRAFVFVCSFAFIQCTNGLGEKSNKTRTSIPAYLGWLTVHCVDGIRVGKLSLSLFHWTHNFRVTKITENKNFRSFWAVFVLTLFFFANVCLWMDVGISCLFQDNGWMKWTG